VRGILILLTLGFVLSNLFNLTMLQFLLRASIPALIFVIPVLFAPELRRALEQLGRAGALIPRTTVVSTNTRMADMVADAAHQLAERRFGALLVIERSTPLGEFASSGVAVDALLSPELLLNIFWPNSPLHDGAVIIHADRVAAVVPEIRLSNQYSSSATIAISSSELTPKRPENALGMLIRMSSTLWRGALMSIHSVSPCPAAARAAPSGRVDGSRPDRGRPNAARRGPRR
jgi:hypothetical protein